MEKYTKLAESNDKIFENRNLKKKKLRILKGCSFNQGAVFFMFELLKNYCKKKTSFLYSMIGSLSFIDFSVPLDR